MNLLEARQVAKRYRRGGLFGKRSEVRVLEDVSIALEEGKGLGLVGRSGSGKSTLGRLLLGLERPDEGQILYKGKDIFASGKEHFRRFRRDVQVVFQNSLGAVNPRFRAVDIVAEPLDNFEPLSAAERRRRVAALLDGVGLSETDLDKFPSQFSGGELQRLCIARALAPRPRVIILDEAVSNLDMLIQVQVLNLLRRLRDNSGTTFLFVSHDLRLVADMCDSVAILADGHIVERTSPEKPLRDFSHPAFLELLDAVLPARPDGSGVFRNILSQERTA